MEKNKICNICFKKFTRKWNLERHLDDVHKVYDDLEKAKMQQGIDLADNITKMMETKSKNFDDDSKRSQLQTNQNYYNNNNLPYTFPNYYYYYNNNNDNNSSLIPFSYINSQYREEERKLTIDDKIKIQKILKNLENYLEKFCPSMFIFRILSWLRYQCLSQKAISL